MGGAGNALKSVAAPDVESVADVLADGALRAKGPDTAAVDMELLGVLPVLGPPDWSHFARLPGANAP